MKLEKKSEWGSFYYTEKGKNERVQLKKGPILVTFPDGTQGTFDLLCRKTIEHICDMDGLRNAIRFDPEKAELVASTLSNYRDIPDNDYTPVFRGLSFEEFDLFIGHDSNRVWSKINLGNAESRSSDNLCIRYNDKGQMVISSLDWYF